jgi:hypothetical protein
MKSLNILMYDKNVYTGVSNPISISFVNRNPVHAERMHLLVRHTIKSPATFTLILCSQFGPPDASVDFHVTRHALRGDLART